MSERNCDNGHHFRAFPLKGQGDARSAVCFRCGAVQVFDPTALIDPERPASGTIRRASVPPTRADGAELPRNLPSSPPPPPPEAFAASSPGFRPPAPPGGASPTATTRKLTKAQVRRMIDQETRPMPLHPPHCPASMSRGAPCVCGAGAAGGRRGG